MIFKRFFFIVLWQLCPLATTGFADQGFIVPEKIRPLLNKKHHHHGPNCWGTALYLKGLSSSPRFVDTAEIRYWLESPLCRELEEGEKMRPGDLLNVYGPEYIFEDDFTLSAQQKLVNLLEPGRYQEIQKTGYSGYHRFLHTETIVSEKKVFGKESPNKLDPFKFTPIQEVYGRPREDKSCQEANERSPYLRIFQRPAQNIRASKCSYFTKVYRCSHFNDFFERQDHDFFEQLFRFQDDLFERVVRAKNITPSKKRQMREFIDKHADALHEQLNSTHSKQEEMMIMWKLFSIEHLKEIQRLQDF